jgi:hypothetical protein
MIFIKESVMAQQLFFYQDLTEIAENPIKELLQQAKETEAREDASHTAGSYCRDCAVCVYLAWRDATEGWHTEADLKRLEALAHGTAWAD